MSEQEQRDALRAIADVAALAGIRGRINEEQQRFEAGFDLPGGRSQNVYIRLTGRDIKNAGVITFFSPCLIVDKGFLKGISKQQALELLERNENVLLARYGIWRSDTQDMIVASVDHLLDTLDPQEFESLVWHVAIAADAYEKQFGKDDF